MAHDFIPFVMAAGLKTNSKMNTSRIIEGVIIAAFSGLISVYGTVSALGAKIAECEKHHDHLQQQINRIHDDVYVPGGVRK